MRTLNSYTGIEVPHAVEDNVVVIVDGVIAVDKNTVGEMELIQILRDAMEKRMADRNAKQVGESRRPGRKEKGEMK